MLNAAMKEVASVVLAAGRGSRMTGYEGNKTLLPLVPAPGSLYEGGRPMLLEVLENLPPGPKGIVVNHCAGDVERAAADFHPSFLLQPVTNGTGGALLAARPFLESATQEAVVITMGDVPLIRPDTYRSLIRLLDDNVLAVLGFLPGDRAQYGLLEMEGDRVLRIVEWKYWKDYPPERRAALGHCNAGVYAARRSELLRYLDRFAGQPHHVRKQRGDEWVTIEEYFLTDMVELMGGDGLPTGMAPASEEEVAGVDTPESLRRVQERFARLSKSRLNDR